MCFERARERTRDGVRREKRAKSRLNAVGHEIYRRERPDRDGGDGGDGGGVLLDGRRDDDDRDGEA